MNLEDAQGFYDHEEEIGGQASMGNVEIEFDGRRDRRGTVIICFNVSLLCEPHTTSTIF
jgi:hypothetical protein